MFGGHHYQSSPRPTASRTQQRKVDALGRPAGEDDLPRRGTDCCCHLVPSRLDYRPSLEPEVMGATAGVAVVVRQPGQHRLQHQRIEPGRGVVVEIDPGISRHPLILTDNAARQQRVAVGSAQTSGCHRVEGNLGPGLEPLTIGQQAGQRLKATLNQLRLP